MPTCDRPVPADHPAFDGHFPGDPLLPGVALLAEALEAILAEPALAARIGPCPRLAQVKFLTPVRPGATLNIDVVGEPQGVRFEIREAGRVAASGRFEAVDAA